MNTTIETIETHRLTLELETPELEELYVALQVGRRTEHQKNCLKTLALELETARPSLKPLKPAEPKPKAKAPAAAAKTPAAADDKGKSSGDEKQK